MTRYTQKDEDLFKVLEHLLKNSKVEKKEQGTRVVNNFLKKYYKAENIQKAMNDLIDKRICAKSAGLKNNQVIKNLYEKLKDSLGNELLQSSVDSISENSSIKDIIDYVKNAEGQKQHYRYILSHGVYILYKKIAAENDKNLKITFESKIKENFKFSVRYGYQYKKFYELCERFERLKYATIPTRDLFNNIKGLEEEIEKDEHFWNNNVEMSSPKATDKTMIQRNATMERESTKK